jgi:hypothetical protein
MQLKLPLCDWVIMLHSAFPRSGEPSRLVQPDEGGVAGSDARHDSAAGQSGPIRVALG